MRLALPLVSRFQAWPILRRDLSKEVSFGASVANRKGTATATAEKIPANRRAAIERRNDRMQ